MSTEFLVFTSLVAFVATVLNIILFFKIWGMTINVKGLLKISEAHFGKKYFPEKDGVISDFDKYKELKKEYSDLFNVTTRGSEGLTERINKQKQIQKEIDNLIEKI